MPLRTLGVLMFQLFVSRMHAYVRQPLRILGIMGVCHTDVLHTVQFCDFVLVSVEILDCVALAAGSDGARDTGVAGIFVSGHPRLGHQRTQGQHSPMPFIALL